MTDTKKNESKKEYAYVCLVMKGDRYVPGAIVAAHSIRKSKTPHDIICMVTNDVTADAVCNLRKVFDRVVNVDYIEFKTAPMRNTKIQALYGNWISQSYTKWNVLMMVSYKKILFMDCDLVVVKNMDHLFYLNAPAATFSMALNVKGNKRFNPYTTHHGEYVKRNEIAVGYDRFLCISTSMLLVPNIKHFKQYINMMKKLEPYKARCINGSDESSIVWFYDRILKERWTHIHQAYNMIPWKKYWLPKKGKFSKPFVQHYTGKDKPWELDAKKWSDLKIWNSFALDVEEHYGVKVTYPVDSVTLNNYDAISKSVETFNEHFDYLHFEDV
jgi:lipopolysaccharide biosynthesis glycosyltransferase